jgi:hypothetical protein
MAGFYRTMAPCGKDGRWGNAGEGGRKAFFSEEKNQKTFFRSLVLGFSSTGDARVATP